MLLLRAAWLQVMSELPGTSVGLYVGVFSVCLNFSNELPLFEENLVLISSLCRDVWVEGSAIRAGHFYPIEVVSG